METLSLLAVPIAVILTGVTAVSLVRVLRQTRRQARRAATRAGRQERLAELGRRVLAGAAPDELRSAALDFLSAGLGVERTAVFQTRGGELLPVAGSGWSDDDLRLPLGPTSQAGASLEEGNVVVCEAGAREKRFPGDAPLVARGARGGVTVPIRGVQTAPAVLAAFDADGRCWSADDIHFVESLAGMLGAGLGWREEERALRASEEMRRSITESSPDYIMKVDRNGTILYINRAVPGLTVDSMIGTPVYDHVPEEARPVLAACYRRVFETGTPDGYDVVYVAADGLKTHFECRVGPVMQDGAVDALIVNASDVTSRVRADEEKAVLEAKLRQSQKLEAVGTLASGVAHDFNNLLTAITGSADLALDRLDADHPARRSLKMIKKVTGQAVSVTRSLLTFGRRTEACKQPEHLPRVVAESMGFLRRLLPAAIDIRLENTDDSIWVDADRDQIQQVLMNLALNSRDTMPDGGVLSVQVSAAEDGRAAILTVTDDGAGMDPGLVGRIFEPFFTTKPRGKGTGLGLAVVHGIVRDHGGAIDVTSRPGSGTTFTVRLPRTEPPGRNRGKARSGRATVSPRGPILLAEDDEDVRSVLLAGLERAGVDVIAVADGDEALTRFVERADEVRLVVLDVDLPRRSGLACLDAIREQRPDLPAVFITGDPARMRDRELQPHERLLAKPFPTDELVARIAELLT